MEETDINLASLERICDRNSGWLEIELRNGSGRKQSRGCGISSEPLFPFAKEPQIRGKEKANIVIGLNSCQIKYSEVQKSLKATTNKTY